MAFKYFEHKADVGIIGIGKTLEEAFEEGAKAMFNVMVDIDKVEPKETIKIECEASNNEELFIEWLNKLLAEAGINNMVFSEFRTESIKDYKLFGSARGETLVPEKHNIKTEVKAATYSQLSIKKENDNYIVKCVLDV